jgi:colanic acid biosynthesis glycosyl transferase WcaI
MPSLQGKEITLISLNFYPEQTAIGLYSTQWAQFLESQGAKVTVLTAFPYYPQWKIHKEYRDKKSFIEEQLGNIRIIRYKQYTPSKPTFLKRIVHIIDFTLGSWRNLRKIKSCDIVISVIPFTSSAWLGNKLSRKHNAKHWIHIQDFEFDAAFQSGLTESKNTSGGLAYKQLMKLERRILNKANKVSTISHNMMAKLALKTTTASYYLPNWVEAKDIENNETHPYLASSKFTILYSGNIGDKQDWAFFIKVVLQLDFNEYDVIIVGDGSKKTWLQQALKGEKGIQFYAPVPFSELSALLTSADAHILFQKTEILDTVMPSKVLGMMASSRPSIVTGHADAEVGAVLNDSRGGYYVDENNAETILGKLEMLKNDFQMAQTMGVNARGYVLEMYAKKPILNAFCNELSQL